MNRSNFRRWLTSLFLSVVCLIATPSLARDSVRFSLLTCSPGTQVYELFGHTAIRYQNFSKNIDWVYNYGVFDFDAPHFIWRFVRGETDYMLDYVPFYFFEKVYSQRGSNVYEQELSLNAEESERLFTSLYLNALPENRIYRYNYFYDNCTTRARDRIEEALSGNIVYPHHTDKYTYREWIHLCTEKHPWARFGIDLCLGCDADKAINNRERMFLPANLQESFKFGQIKNSTDTVKRPLVCKEKILIKGEEQRDTSVFPLSPMQTMLLILIITLLLSCIEYRTHRIFFLWDIILFATQGLAGCLITFLFFFSIHPTVSSNFLLIILNPLPLFYLPFMIYHIRKGRKDIYDVANIIILTLFISFLWLIPQKISLEIVPLALSLQLRSVLHLYVAHRKGIKFKAK